jgi:formamidopyrimidine-DNA glycosylase
VPELPELTIYAERLEEALGGRALLRPRVHDPFVLRSVDPPLEAIEGRRAEGVARRAKFLVVELGASPGNDAPPRLELALHLMLGGRLHLRDPAAWKPHRKRTLFSVASDGGPLLEMTEAGTKRRASLSVLGPASDRRRLERGVDPLDPALDAATLGAILRRRNRQLAGALRDPEGLAGIGNAYADEILFAARLSPVKLTSRLDDAEIERLHAAMRSVLSDWTERVRRACPEGLPVRQKDWRAGMAVHGRAGEPCPVCGEPIGRIARKDAETNYCPTCQNEGRLLADRRLSRLGIRRPPRSGA